jgi:hypothetical protein
MGDDGFMVFTIKISLVPFSERRLHRKVDKAIVGASLKTNIADYFSVGDAGLVFQEEVVFE